MIEERDRVAEFFPNGCLRCEYFVLNGLKEGTERHWFEDGKPFVSAEYLDGRLNGRLLEWNESGVLVKSANYREGRLEGKYQSWWDSGILKEDGYFESGIRRVGYTWYFQDGKVWSVPSTAEQV